MIRVSMMRTTGVSPPEGGNCEAGLERSTAVTENILEIRGITKLYPGVTALKDVNLSFRRGEVHALCGENGAGKSTLIKIISGAVTPTSGEIVIEGKVYSEMTPALSREKGVAVVYQEFTLVPVMTAAENIFLGNFRKRGVVVDRKAMASEAEDLFRRMNVMLDPREYVKDLTTGYQQIVEIAKALSCHAKILIMDEPSAPLTNNELESMFHIVRTLKEEGVTIIYISHRLDEIFGLADRVSVLRDGEYIGTQNIAETSKEELIKMMVGRTLSQTYPQHNYMTEEVVLEARNLSGNGVKDVSFTLHRGEILGFGGLIGAGRTEFCEMLFGRYPIRSGELYLKGRRIEPSSPAKAVSMGITLVPEDRKRHGIIDKMSVRDNLTISNLKRLRKGPIISQRAQMQYAQRQVDALKIKTPGLSQLVKNLSGGNQQKTVLGRWLGIDPEILIFDEPTRGIDVGAKAEIYKIMVELVKAGKSIIMVSSEMEELLGMSDRLLILAKGRYAGLLDREDFSQETVLKYSSGGGCA